MVVALAEKQRLKQEAWQAAASVVDPEIPVLTIEDLGILRDVRIENGCAVVEISPTYSGCPAVAVIELAVETALLEAGFEPKIERAISPPWTTDWISEKGREKLVEFGIAPPATSSNSKLAMFGETTVNCPLCNSAKTSKVSEFGSTACKALYRCNTCGEPFDYFKCI